MRRVRPLWAVAVAALLGALFAIQERAATLPGAHVDRRAAAGPGATDAPAFDPHGDRPPSRTQGESAIDGRALREAIAARASDRWVEGAGTVDDALPDDRRGSRHQRFIVRLPDGATVLVAHNIDLAPRVDGLREGDRVEFRGEFEWNARGGVVHWTHHDPKGRRAGGWLRHAGRVYR
jgi:hypothetical protein